MRLGSETGERIRRALASEQRVRLLGILGARAMNVSEIAAKLGLSQPTVSAHVRALEDAGLIECWFASTGRGSEKRCAAKFGRMTFELGPVSAEGGESLLEAAMPVGLFTAISVRPPCGMASNSRVIGFLDNPQSFLMPERPEAQILWFGGGWIEYTFPCDLPPTAEITGIEFVAELSSMAASQDSQHPSDITVWMNGVEVGTWTARGGLSSRPGKLNPDWWSDHLTQFGILKSWSANASGGFVDGVPAGPGRLVDLEAGRQQPVAVRIGNKPDALHPGGVSLFGKRFGNYPQDLILRIRYQLRTGRAQPGPGLTEQRGEPIPKGRG